VFDGKREDAFLENRSDIRQSSAFRRGPVDGRRQGLTRTGYNVPTPSRCRFRFSQIDTSSHVVGVWASTERQQIRSAR